MTTWLIIVICVAGILYLASGVFYMIVSNVADVLGSCISDIANEFLYYFLGDKAEKIETKNISCFLKIVKNVYLVVLWPVDFFIICIIPWIKEKCEILFIKPKPA